MDIYGSYFTYGNFNSEDYNLVLSSAESERDRSLAGSIEGTTIFNRRDNRDYFVGDDYSGSSLSMAIDITTCDGSPLSDTDIRTVEKYLFNRQSYRNLYFTDDTSEKKVYVHGRFINPSKLEYNGGIVGFSTTLVTDNNMLWETPTEITIPVNNESISAVTNISVTTDTDMDDYIYPKVTINMGSSGGDVIIVNQSDSSTRLTQFSNLGGNVSVVMDGTINYISGDYYNAFTYQNFIRLLDGVNTFSVMGNISSIKFEYQNRRML